MSFAEQSVQVCDAPRYDATLGAWMLTRHADVAAALREPALSMSDGDVADLPTFAAAQLATWRDGAESSARRMVASLPTGEPVDLVRAFAAPWSLALACDVTGASSAHAPRLAALARAVFLAAAHATDASLAPDAHRAVAALAAALPATPLAVQAFVALTQTLPCTLAGAWHALLAHPDQARLLRAEPALLPRAVDELLRHAGPSRAVFRRARADVAIGGAHVAAGDRVALMLSAANHDPARFPDPWRLDVRRRTAGHVALGGGAHACAGGSVVRVALSVATGALLDAAAVIEPAGEPTWLGGFAIRGVASLPVVLRASPSS